MAARLLLCLAVLLAALGISCRGEDEPPDDGEGVAPESTAAGTPEQPPLLWASINSHDFGELCLGFCRETVDIRFDTAEGSVEVHDFSLQSDHDLQAFEIEANCDENIGRGNDCELEVAFRPRSLGLHDLEIVIEHSGANSPTRIELTGTGTCPEGSGPVPDALLGLLDERVGFGKDVTGAANGCTYVVDSEDDDGEGSLREIAEAGGYWITFARDLDIEIDSNIAVGGNTTIDGRGRKVDITGGGIHMRSASQSNVILNDIRLAHSTSDLNDLLRVGQGASSFWFHHLELSDSVDEYIDISQATEAGVVGTISWTHFARGGPQNTNEYAVLMGDQNGNETNDLIRITLHHNWFDGTRQRHPMVNGAYAHTFNNVIRWRLWGIQARRDGSRLGANVLSENDVFDASDAPENRGDGSRTFDDDNALRVSNPLLLNGAGIAESNAESVFNPAEYYGYELDAVEDVLEIVTNGAGPRTTEAVFSP